MTELNKPPLNGKAMELFEEQVLPLKHDLIDAYGNATYGYKRAKYDDIYVCKGRACHADMKATTLGKSKIDFAFTMPLAFNKEKGYSPLEKEYLKWILNKRVSPWRSLLKSNAYMYKGRMLNSYDWVTRNNFVVFPNVEVPGNLLVNFMVATRHIREKMSLVEMWFDLYHNHGIHPNVAYWFASAFMSQGLANNYRQFMEKPKITKLKYPESMVFSLQYNQGHHPLSFNVYSDDAFKNFCTGNPVNLHKKMYSESGNYKPCNHLWEHPDNINKHDKNTKLENFSNSVEARKDNTYLDTLIGKYKPSTNAIMGKFFKRAQSAFRSYKYDQIIQMAKDEQKRIGLK